MGFPGPALGKTHSTSFKPTGIYRGKVTRLEAVTNRLFVQIERISVSFEYGPLDFIETPGGYAANDQVALAPFEGLIDSWVVIGKVGP